MTEFKALSLSECIERLLSLERPLVVMHVRPDGDTVGSGAGLCRIFEALGRQAAYISGDKIPERLAFLVEGLTATQNTSGYECVSIDVPSPSQLGPLSGENIEFMIDHHEISTPFAPHYTIKGASSAGEVLYGIARELERMGLISITPEIAAPIYAAIASDTGGFAYSSATPETYRVAAELIECGIDHANINHRLFSSKPRAQLCAEGLVASKIMTAKKGKIAYATITKAERDALGIAAEHFETAIDVVRSLMGAVLSFVVKETDSGEYKASLRSTDKNVALVAKKFSGGGHNLAAGCTPKADTIEQARDLILSELSTLLD